MSPQDFKEHESAFRRELTFVLRLDVLLDEIESSLLDVALHRRRYCSRGNRFAEKNVLEVGPRGTNGGQIGNPRVSRPRLILELSKLLNARQPRELLLSQPKPLSLLAQAAAHPLSNRLVLCGHVRNYMFC